MPQMSPIYWLNISLFCYFNSMMMMILINTFYFTISVYKKKYFMNMWKWFWQMFLKIFILQQIFMYR